MRWDASQGLDESQRERARENIAAVGYDEQSLSSDERSQARENIAAVAYDAQTLTDNQKEQARDNINAARRSFVDARDYGIVGDGVADDFAALQAAIDTESDVHIPKPSVRYRITDELTLAVDGQRIFGSGLPEIRQVTAEKNVIAATNLTGCRIEGLHLYAVGDIGSMATGGGAAFFGCSRVVARDLLVENHRGAGVNFYNTNDSFALYNTFINSPVEDGDLNNVTLADIAAVFSSSRNVIAGNNCRSGNGSGIIVQSILDEDTCDDNVIYGNIVENAKAYGIILYRVDPSGGDVRYTRRNVVVGNTIKNITGTIISALDGTTYPFGAGIYVQGAEDTVVSGNNLSQTHSGAVTFTEQLSPGAIGVGNVTRYTITGNVIRDDQMYGILCHDGNGLGEADGFAVITGNQITDTLLNGIRINSRGRTNITGNTCDGTQGIRHTGSASKRAAITVNSNSVINTVASQPGINIDNALEANVVGNLTKTTAGANGISISNTDLAAVTGNTIIDFAVRGVEIAATVTQAHVSGNTIRGTGTSLVGMRLNGPTQYADNLISGVVTEIDGTYAPWATLTVDGATPSVAQGNNFITANVNPTTITNFTGAYDGKVIWVLFTDANTTLDFTSSNLKGNAGSDRAMAAGDAIMAVYRKSTFAWHVIIIDATA
ncbi:MAG: right-handed parallel beta-helix repeat-containing protein [Nitrospiraceae bacterium]